MRLDTRTVTELTKNWTCVNEALYIIVENTTNAEVRHQTRTAILEGRSSASAALRSQLELDRKLEALRYE